MKNRIIVIILFLIAAFVPKLVPDSNKGRTENEYLNYENHPAIAGLTKEIYVYMEEYNSTYFVIIPRNVKWNDGWINASDVNIRTSNSLESEVVGQLKYNDKIKYYNFDNEWRIVKIDNYVLYIYSDFISDHEMKYMDYDLQNTTSGYKSYMSYRAITDTKSKQYKLQMISYTGKYGIRQVNGRFCVALGTAFDANIGTYFDLILDNGEVIPCILGDIKSNRHTDKDNIVTSSNGCMSEFIVDTNLLNANVKSSGDISSCDEKWDDRVTTVRVYEKNIFD